MMNGRLKLAINMIRNSTIVLYEQMNTHSFGVFVVLLFWKLASEKSTVYQGVRKTIHFKTNHSFEMQKPYWSNGFVWFRCFLSVKLLWINCDRFQKYYYLLEAQISLSI